jgi:hypothetical protein
MFSQDGVLRKLFKDDERLGEIILRLNVWEHRKKNWLSMRPETSNYFKVDQYGTFFGEFNENN